MAHAGQEVGSKLRRFERKIVRPITGAIGLPFAALAAVDIQQYSFVVGGDLSLGVVNGASQSIRSEWMKFHASGSADSRRDRGRDGSGSI
jgi:hypothetical protein